MCPPASRVDETKVTTDALPCSHAATLPNQQPRMGIEEVLERDTLRERSPQAMQGLRRWCEEEAILRPGGAWRCKHYMKAACPSAAGACSNQARSTSRKERRESRLRHSAFVAIQQINRSITRISPAGSPAPGPGLCRRGSSPAHRGRTGSTGRSRRQRDRSIDPVRVMALRSNVQPESQIDG